MEKLQIITWSLFIALLFAFALLVYAEMRNVEKDIEICKSRGYDGISFREWSIGVETYCSNFDDTNSRNKGESETS